MVARADRDHVAGRGRFGHPGGHVGSPFHLHLVLEGAELSEAAPETVARPLHTCAMPPARPVNAALKRGLDVGVSLLGLILASPLLLAAAIAVKLDSRGPLLFRQQRMGRNFRPFLIYKFRTVGVDAGRQGQLTAGADPRVTRVGRWLRQSKLDELPQLFNVLRGDMSLVGPRPEVPKYVELFRDEYRVVLSVRPGLTDPASI